MTWDGLEELKAALRNLPGELGDDATAIVNTAAEDAMAGVIAAYEGHVLTGDLVGHVFLSQEARNKFGATYVVKNTAKHAWIFEEGTQARHYVTVHGKTHLTGAMPPSHVFVQTMVRARRQMYANLKDLLAQKGLEVSGDA